MGEWDGIYRVSVFEAVVVFIFATPEFLDQGAKLQGVTTELSSTV